MTASTSSNVRHTGQILALGSAQTIAWASSNYLPAILAAPIALDLGISRATVFGAFSVALVVTGLAGPAVGRLIDRGHGRAMLVASNIVHIIGLLLLAGASSPQLLFAAWIVLGAGMAMGLYDAAFATLVRLHGDAARTPITGITLIAGFASTLGWPLTAWIAGAEGWRTACMAWSAIHLCIALPLNALCIPSAPARPPGHRDASRPAASASAPELKSQPSAHQAPPRNAFAMLVLYFAATAFVTSAMGAHLPGLLAAGGISAATALAAAALMGPAQVAARLTEFLAMRRYRFHPMLTARIAGTLQPLGVAVLIATGGLPLVASLAPFAYTLLYGAGNGMLTIAKGTLPLALFGPESYGLRQGLLNVVARAMQALAPFAFGWMMDDLGTRVSLLISAAVSLLALGALFMVRVGTHRSVH
jgi:MFS family permease